MKIRGLLLDTMDGQASGGDGYAIDPERVTFENQEVPVRVHFDTARGVGTTTKFWREDGRVYFEADLNDEAVAALSSPLPKLACIGIKNVNLQDHVAFGEIFAVGLADQNQNANQPEFEVIP